MNEMLIALAKAAILVSLQQPEEFDLQQALEKYPQLKEHAATFVTLTTEPDERLRGCIGTLEAYRPLYKDIIANAQSAAMRDPRFPPLTAEEFKQVHIEVSLLSQPKKLTYSTIEDLKKKITAFKDGVVLKHLNHQATYLPQVWEQLPDFDTFFASLCQKANLNTDCLLSHPEIFLYQVTKYKEK